MAISSNTTGLRPGVCTSTSRPSSPYEGQTIYETDTDRTLVYDSAAWIVVSKTTGGGSNFRLGYQSRTTSYSPGASIAAAGDIFTSDITWTADGTSTYWIEFYCPFVYTAAAADANVTVYLVDGSGNDLGRIALVGPAESSSRRQYGYVMSKFPYTPSSGSRLVNIRATYSSGSDALLVAGPGGAGGDMPIWCAVYGPALT